MSSAQEIRQIALAEFAAAGYSGTPLQRIADAAGISKSAVLYHFPSKEALLEAAIAPAIGRMGSIITALTSEPGAESQGRFIDEFTDFLLEYRLEVHLFVNQGPSLVDVPVVDRANDLVRRLAEYFTSTTASTEEKMRFGIALGGAAYMLCTTQSLDLEPAPIDETRAALVTIMTELLAPVGARAS